MEILFIGIAAAALLVLGLQRFLDWRQRSQPVEVSLNTVVDMHFRSEPGTVAVGHDALVVFHPFLIRNYYAFDEIRRVSVTHWFDSRLVVTWDNGSRLSLVTPWARELKALLEERRKANYFCVPDGSTPPLRARTLRSTSGS